MSELRIGAASLRDFVRDIFVAAGFAPADAACVADMLVWANLRGIESHGVLRVANYLGFVDKGEMNPKARPRVTTDKPAAVLIDADRAAGAVAMTFATEHAVAKAKAAGIGLALVRRTTHTGPIGYFALQAAAQNMAGIVLSASTPNMAYHGAARAGVSNNPLAIAVPSAARVPLAFDMATSVAAAGKLKQAQDSGTAIPVGWALTADGKPATDPAQADVLLPVGGAKGAGLSLMIECLTSLMVGNPLIEPIVAGREKRGHRQNALVMALDVAAFTDATGFGGAVAALTAALKGLPRAADADSIQVPGERGPLTEAERRKSGIPLAAGTWKKLGDLARKRGVAVPAVA